MAFESLIAIRESRLMCLFRGVLVLLAIAVAVPSGRSQDVALSGGFGVSTPALDPERTSDLLKEGPIWDSWQNDDTRVGRLTIGPFQTADAIELWVNGFPASPNERIYLQSAESDQTRLRLVTRAAPGGAWTRYRWALPPQWRKVSAKLVAEDTTPEQNQWLGVSRPLAPSLQLKPAIAQVLLQIAVSCLLLLPALAVLGLLPPLQSIPALATILVASGSLTYFIFFFYFEFPALGPALSYGILFCSVLIALFRWRAVLRYLVDPHFYLPVALSVAVGAFYVSLCYSYGGVQSPDAIPLMRFFPELAPDPLLPYWFAEKIALHQPLRPFFIDWLTSDRPPLQTGIDLLYWPLLSGKLAYEAIGAAVQSWVWIGLWIFLRALTITAEKCAWILASSVLTGFYFLNTVYCWPKLLPTTFLLVGAAIIFGDERIDWQGVKGAVLCSASIALALLAHGGSYFGVASIALVCLIMRRPISIKLLAIGLIIVETLLLPWQLYQHFVDPPGDRLIKYHLAGHPTIDPRSSWLVIKEAYLQLGWEGILANKWGSISYVFYGWKNWSAASIHSFQLVTTGHWAQAYRTFSSATRDGEFHFYSLALAPLILAVFGIFRLSSSQTSSDAKAMRLATSLLICSLIVWCLLMFGWGTTAIQNSSLFTGSMLFIVFGLILSSCASRFRVFLLGFELVWFWGIWIYASQRQPQSEGWYPSIFPGYVFTDVLLFGVTIVILFLLTRMDRLRGDAS